MRTKGAKKSAWLLLVTLLAFGCTESDPESAGITLLVKLISDVPEVPVPVETSLNADNPCYQQTRNRLSWIVWRRDSFHLYLSRVLNEWDGPTLQGAAYEWTLPHEDGMSSRLFRLTPGDTIRFSFSASGPAYELYAPLDGWYVPTFNSGRIYVPGVPYNGFGWGRVPQGIEMGSSNGDLSYAVVDSTQGGGTISVDESVLAANVFEAGWDTLGHGWCWPPTIGSGW
jgi:hypothetical protein